MKGDNLFQNNIKTEKQIKILMIGPYPPPYGGIAIVIRDLLDSPLKEKFDLQLLKTQPAGEIEFKRFFYDIKNLINKLINHKPDIVHLHTSYDWGWPKIITYAIICKLFGKKIILHLHAYDRRCKSSFPKKWLIRYIYPPSFGLKLVDYVFTLSDGYSKKIKKKYININVKTIKNGILRKRFKDTYKKIDKSKFIITHIKLSKSKGICEIMQVAPKIIEEYPNVNFYLIGSGDFSEKVKNWHSHLDSKIKNNIIITGMISNDRVIEILKITEIFVLQSESEALPITILEAMATSCSIITTPVGRITELITNGVNGLLISPNDADQLYESLCTLIENPNLLHTIKENNKKQSMKYSWEEISKQIEDTYLYLYGEK